MDEVEPALDDVNLHRFLRLVEGFARESQVLIVTHQKRTMEIAAMMYGISLNKDGTTKVVAQQLDHQRRSRPTPGSKASASPAHALRRLRRRRRGRRRPARRACRRASRSASLPPWNPHRHLRRSWPSSPSSRSSRSRPTRSRARGARAGTHAGEGHVRAPAPLHPAKQRHEPIRARAGSVGWRLPQGGSRRQGQGAVHGRRRRRDVEAARGPPDQGRRRAEGVRRSRAARSGPALGRRRPGRAAPRRDRCGPGPRRAAPPAARTTGRRAGRRV